MDRDQVLPILEQCFRGASHVKIVQSDVEEGDRHLSSDITRFVVEFERNRKTERAQVIMKVPTSTSLFLVFNGNKVYDKEIGIYERVMPRINKYLDETLAPAHLYTAHSKIFVLEDLTARGYSSGEKLTALDLPQIKCCLKALAHFHAASHKLYEEDAAIAEDLFSFYFSGTILRQLSTNWGSVVQQLLKRKHENRLLAKVNEIISFFQKDDDELTAILDKSKYKFVVLNHGDFRKDNIFFKSATSQVQVQFIDFQNVIWCSPAFDILYFFTIAVSADILEAHFDDLLDEYFRELNKKLRSLKCAYTYQRQDFDEDLKTLKYFLFFCLSCLCGFVSPLDRQQVGESFSKSDTDISQLCNLCFNDERFVRVIHGWLKFFEKSSLFDQF